MSIRVMVYCYYDEAKPIIVYYDASSIVPILLQQSPEKEDPVAIS